MKKQPGCEKLPMRTPLGAVSVLLPLSPPPGNFRRQCGEANGKKLNSRIGGEDGGEGGVLESKDNLERGRAQQEAYECGMQNNEQPPVLPYGCLSSTCRRRKQRITVDGTAW
jgi:hypothetical protein